MTLSVTRLEELRPIIDGWRTGSERIVLVPTMGALHEGHAALVREAKKHGTKVVVSIFVNPAQFGPHEDFSRYPRMVEHDLALLHELQADLVWLPSVEEMYPHGFATTVHISGISEDLCGSFRPRHFDGVATVVAKLFMQIQPHVALFGEKDYQQLCVIRRMVRDLDLPVDIRGVPTVREPDGLALSSRNQYLNETQRKAAPALYKALQTLAGTLSEGKDDFSILVEKAKQTLLAAGFEKIDYLELCTNDTLEPLTGYQKPSRLLVAAWIGKTRLIDNVEITE